MDLIFSGGINVFGIPVNAALFGFLLIFLIFGGLNLLEFKRLD